MKKIVVIISAIFAISFLAGCGNKQANSTEENNAVSNVEQKSKKRESLTVDSAIEKFKTNGFSAGQKRESLYQMIGAYDGAKIDVDKTTIEIYQYKDAQKEAKAEARKTMETADSIIFESDSLLVVVHSKDVEFANKLKLALE